MNDDLKQENCDFDLDGEEAFALAMLIILRLRDAIIAGGGGCPIPKKSRDMVGGTLTYAVDQILEVAKSWSVADGMLDRVDRRVEEKRQCQ